MEQKLKSFIVYFYDGDALTDDGVELFDICEEYFTEEQYPIEISCYDIENEWVAKIQDNECKVIIQTIDKEIVFERCKIEVLRYCGHGMFNGCLRICNIEI